MPQIESSDSLQAIGKDVTTVESLALINWARLVADQKI